MKLIIENWRLFLQEKKKSNKDSKKVAKIILFDKDNHVLFLKRTNYMKKHAGEWDLPGGHIYEDEKLLDGLRREVKEETGLDIGSVKKIKNIGNTYFFVSSVPEGDIKLSNEHSDYKMRDVKSIKKPDKYEKVAQEALKNEQL